MQLEVLTIAHEVSAIRCIMGLIWLRNIVKKLPPQLPCLGWTNLQLRALNECGSSFYGIQAKYVPFLRQLQPSGLHRKCRKLLHG